MFLVLLKESVHAQCMYEIQSTYEVYNRFAIADNYSIDSLTDLEVVRMIPKHYIVDEYFCIASDSSSTTTKEYTWLLSNASSNLYDKVVIDENGSSLYKNENLVHYGRSVESDNSMFHYTREELAFLGFKHPIKWFPQVLIDSIISAGYSVTTLTSDSAQIISNDSMSIRYDINNQYVLWKHFNAQGQLVRARFKAVYRINDSLAVPKAEYNLTVHFTSKGIPLSETIYKVYSNYAINDTSYLQNNQYLQYTPKPTTKKKKSLSIVESIERTQNIIQVFPNPVQDRLTIEVPAKFKGSYTLTIRTVNGTLIKSKNYAYSSRLLVNLNSISPGVYFLHLQSESNSFTQKIIIQ